MKPKLSQDKTDRPRVQKTNGLSALPYLLGTGTLLGASADVAKLSSTQGLHPATLLVWSTVGATAVLTLIMGVRGQLPKPSRRLVEYAVVSALVGVVGPNLILFSAVPHVGAGFVALATAFPPLLTYVGAVALRMERYNRLRAAGVASALGGAALLAFFQLTAPDAAVVWIAATLSVPVILAVGNLYRTLRWPPGATPQALAPAMLITAAALLLTVGASTELPMQVSFETATPLALILVQTTVFSLQYLLFFKLQESGGPVYLSLIGSVAAVVGIPAAVFLLGEAPLEGLPMGAALIAAGIFLVTRGGTFRRPAADPLRSAGAERARADQGSFTPRPIPALDTNRCGTSDVCPLPETACYAEQNNREESA